MTAQNNVVSIKTSNPVKPVEQVCFNRHDIDILMQFYSKRVGTGEWRDYAMDMLKDQAIFSVFKRASEVPIYTVHKQPKLANKQGEWSIMNANGLVLKRGKDLKQVLKVLDKKPKLVSL